MMELFTRFAACGGGDFLLFPRWHKYLGGVTDPQTKLCSPQLTSLMDIWLIVAALVDLLLRVAALFAVFMVIWGGIKYIMSQGEPNETTQARNTIFNALGGLALALISSFVVAFIAGRFH